MKKVIKFVLCFLGLQPLSVVLIFLIGVSVGSILPFAIIKYRSDKFVRFPEKATNKFFAKEPLSCGDYGKSGCTDTCISKNYFLTLEDHSILWDGDDYLVFEYRKIRKNVSSEFKNQDKTHAFVDSITFKKIMEYIRKNNTHLSIGDIAPLLNLHTVRMYRNRVDTLMVYVLNDLGSSHASGPEHATYMRSQIVNFRGDFLWHVGCLSYGPWFEKWDRKLLFHEKRFEKFLWEQTSKGNFPPNQ